ncbi:hypothetical protein LCGC14_1139570 [marine sediment metagenome]|uniref:Aminoacyl-tRNA synthetase class II (D/K/N) domain-containing protein n=2 Tax=marine sediment metagenome TaxID=412755 RepID=A0A0F9PGY2_9ZZZZ
MSHIDPRDYHNAVKKLRHFFEDKGFIEVHTQSRLSILAACEDPRTIASFHYAGSLFPLPQTGQMWLEHELLSNPDAPGFYCISTSFRNEPNPIPGRHDLIFPMVEFEFPGTMIDLFLMERELIEYLDIAETRYSIPRIRYDEAAEKYGVKELEAEHEEMLQQDFGPVVFLTDFPQYTSPFWNMKKNGDFANKIDVILYGIETIGSAERSTDPDEMRHLFHTISDGMYADILFAQFGRERVQKELETFLSFDFFDRAGGGIGVTRMIRALKLSEEDK